MWYALHSAKSQRIQLTQRRKKLNHIAPGPESMDVRLRSDNRYLGPNYTHSAHC